MNENDIAKEVVDAAFHVHVALGAGLLESVYERVLHHELNKMGLHTKSEVSVPIEYDGIQFNEGFRADLIVEEKVIIELKSVEHLLPVHHKQLLTYLRLMDKRLGLLINFNEAKIKDGIHRIVNGL